MMSVATVGFLALSACSSNPGPRRIAQDIIEAEANVNPNLDEKCLLDELEEFSDSELNQIANNPTAENDTDGNLRTLAEFEAALRACLE
jgi:cytochrome c553